MVLNNATDIRIGSTQASKVYLGSTQVWPYVPIGTNYLKTTARSNNTTFTFSIPAGVDTTHLEYISYSVDNGYTWVKTNNIDNQAVTITTSSISNQSSVLWRGVGTGTTDDNGTSSVFCSFSASNDYDLSGNILSLIWGNTDFDNMSSTTFLQGYTFYKLFYNDTHVVDASQMLLPSLTIRGGSYREMFRGCTSLYKAPSVISATTLAGNCMRSMFAGCTSLEYAPTLPATTMANYAYSGMFVDTTALRNPPALPATTLAIECYQGMFGQSGISSAPALTATTLADNCYENMFANCTNLTQSPDLLATTIATESYKNMFNGCSRLNSVKCLARTGVNSTNCYQWLANVAASGTFIKYPNVIWPSGISGVPTGWTETT